MKHVISHAFRIILETYRTEVEPSRVIHDQGAMALFNQFETDLPEDHLHTAALININDGSDLFELDSMRGICYPCALFITAYMKDVYDYNVSRKDLQTFSDDGTDTLFLHSFIIEDGLHYDTCYVEGLRYIADHPIARQFDEDEEWWLATPPEDQGYVPIYKGTELSDFFIKCADQLYPEGNERSEFKKIFLN